MRPDETYVKIPPQMRERVKKVWVTMLETPEITPVRVGEGTTTWKEHSRTVIMYQINGFSTRLRPFPVFSWEELEEILRKVGGCHIPVMTYLRDTVYVRPSLEEIHNWR